MNNVEEVWVSNKAFPEKIMGKNIFICTHNLSPNHIQQMVMIKQRNNHEFAKYLDIGDYDNFERAKCFIRSRKELTKKRWLVDYAICLPTGKVVGGLILVNIGFRTIGASYFMDKYYRNRGFISEALQLLEPEICKLGYEKIMLSINENNHSSILVAKKNNYQFQETGALIKNFVKDIKQK